MLHVAPWLKSTIRHSPVAGLLGLFATDCGRSPASSTAPSAAAASAMADLQKKPPMPNPGQSATSRTTAPSAIAPMVRVELGDGRLVCVKDDKLVWTTNPDGTLEGGCCATSCGGYRAVVAFWTQVKQLTAAGDVSGLARLSAYPLYVDAGSDNVRVIESEVDFRRNFGTIFTRAVRSQVARAEPSDIFCNWKGARLDDGVLWAYPQEGLSSLRLIVVNQFRSPPELTVPRPTGHSSGPLQVRCGGPGLSVTIPSTMSQHTPGRRRTEKMGGRPAVT